MNNKFFDDSYIEVTLPLSDNLIDKLNTTNFAYLFNELRNAENDPRATGAWCDMTVAFSLCDGKIYFSLTTITTYDDYDSPEFTVTEGIQFPTEAAEMLRDAALQMIARNLADMSECKAAKLNTLVQ